eukprot:gene3869-13933_t
MGVFNEKVTQIHSERCILAAQLSSKLTLNSSGPKLTLMGMPPMAASATPAPTPLDVDMEDAKAALLGGTHASGLGARERSSSQGCSTGGTADPQQEHIGGLHGTFGGCAHTVDPKMGHGEHLTELSTKLRRNVFHEHAAHSTIGDFLATERISDAHLKVSTLLAKVPFVTWQPRILAALQSKCLDKFCYPLPPMGLQPLKDSRLLVEEPRLEVVKILDALPFHWESFVFAIMFHQSDQQKYDVLSNQMRQSKSQMQSKAPFVKTNSFSATTAPKQRMSAATSHGKYNKFKPNKFVPTCNEKQSGSAPYFPGPLQSCEK